MKKSDLDLYIATGITVFLVGGFYVLAYQGKKQSGDRPSDWSWPAQRRVKDEV